MRKIQIGVIGSAGIEEYKNKKKDQKIYQIAEEIGTLLAKNNAIVVTGGKGGVMESVARGAKGENGTIVGIVKGCRRSVSNKYTDIEILTGAQGNGLDEYFLVMSSDAIISINGGAGTLEEITIAYRNDKQVIVLKNTGGWSEKLANKYLDERKKRKILVVNNPEQAVKIALKFAHHNKPFSKKK